MKRSIPSSPVHVGSKHGFTLIELMVAIAVLTIMMLGIMQLVNSTTTITVGGFKHMNADTEARLALDRIAFDVSRMVKRTDVDFYFPLSTTGTDPATFNDQMTFFSESGGYYPSGVQTSGISSQGSNVSLVGYRIATTTDTTGNVSAPQLQRLSKGLVWNGVSSGTSPMVYLPRTIVQTWPDLVAGNGTQDPDYQILGDQIFRFELTYLMQKTFSTGAGASATVNTYTGFSNVPNLEDKTSDQTGYFNPKEVIAIIVSIGVLDARSQKMIPSGTLATVAANSFPNIGSTLAPIATGDTNNPKKPISPVDSSKLPLTAWQSALDTALSDGTNPTPLGLPKAAASQIRFYQRYCYLNTTSQ